MNSAAILADDDPLKAVPRRHLPLIKPENAFFWRAGEQGILQFMRCQACGYYLHPPLPICPSCKCRSVKAEPVSGRGLIASYTVNRQVWERGLDEPYVVAIVELLEQTGLRLTTNLVRCAVEELSIGMPVRVLFDRREDVWLPLFEPEI